MCERCTYVIRIDLRIDTLYFVFPVWALFSTIVSIEVEYLRTMSHHKVSKDDAVYHIAGKFLFVLLLFVCSSVLLFFLCLASGIAAVINFPLVSQ